MYNDFKNDFISDLAQMDINLNKQQMSKILAVLDGTANKYDILNRNNRIKIMNNNGIPQSVYDYIHCKKSEGLTSETLYIYRIILEIFFHTVNKPPEYIEASDIMDFLRDYQEKNHISNRTLDKYRQYICCYFEFIHDYGYIQRNPAHQVKKIKYEVKPMPVLTEYEVELIREACITRREKAIIEFFLSTACRVSELTKVKKSDINWETDEVILFGKGNGEMFVGCQIFFGSTVIENSSGIVFSACNYKGSTGSPITINGGGLVKLVDCVFGSATNITITNNTATVVDGCYLRDGTAVVLN